jgi:hypothetical protein
MMDPSQADQQVQAQLLRAIRDIIGRKMANQELTFRHLGTGDVAAVVPEIIAASGLQQSGIGVGSLSMAFGIDGHAPQPPRGVNAMGPPLPQNNLAAGTFDMGGGQQLRVKINDESTFECGGNDVVVLTGVTATAGVKAAANCQLTMTGVNITAPVGIEASAKAKVIMTGGSTTASTSSVVASGSAKVDLLGTRMSGKEDEHRREDHGSALNDWRSAVGVERCTTAN